MSVCFWSKSVLYQKDENDAAVFFCLAKTETRLVVPGC